jgi:uncharacterized protein
LTKRTCFWQLGSAAEFALARAPTPHESSEEIMTQRPDYSDGAPCWADLSTPDMARTQRFYGELFGWTFQQGGPEFAGYTTCLHDGRKIAGIMQIPAGQPMPTAWGVYLRSSDIEATARRIVELGGALLLPPHAIPGGLGSMLFAADSSGIPFGVWQPGLHRGAEVLDEPGAMSWHELNTRDAARSDQFYRDLFAYEQKQVGDCEGATYSIYSVAGQQVCGRAEMNAAWGDARPQWITYFALADVDAAVAKLPRLEGKLLKGPFDMPQGRMAVIADPFGAAMAIIQRPKTA